MSKIISNLKIEAKSAEEFEDLKAKMLGKDDGNAERVANAKKYIKEHANFLKNAWHLV